MASHKSQDERAADIAQKSESMARELSQKREMRIRQERVRQLSDEDARRPRTPRPGKVHDDRTVRQPEGEVRDTRVEQHPDPPFYPERKPSMLDDVATELEELLRDLRAGWRRFAGADRLTFLSALLVLIGTLLPWTSVGKTMNPGIVIGGGLHAALAVAAIALCVGRARRTDLSSRDRALRARRASLWHLLIGAASMALGAYFLVVFGLQRSSSSGLEIRYGLYVTLAAGMGLSYGGFARFWSKHDVQR